MFKYVCGGTNAVFGGLTPAEINASDATDADTFQPEASGVTCIGPVFGPACYRWALDLGAFHGSTVPAIELVNDFQRSAHQISPSVQLMRVAEATVINNAIYCGDTSSQRILFETFRACEWGAATRANIPIHDFVHGEDLTDPQYLDVYFGTVGYFNYGHWLVDDLPKLKGVVLLMESAERQVRLILPTHDEKMDRIRADSIRLLLNNTIEILFIPPQEPRRFRDLYYVSPVSYHPVNKSPIALDFLVHHALSKASAALPSVKIGETKRIFVTRGGVGVRRLLNEKAVIERLAALDFHVVDASTMSFAEQVMTFSQASVVVGQMGAAMTNTLFCRPTTAVIYLAPDTWREPFYLDLAATRGHYYQVQFGSSEDASQEPHMKDFSADVDQLEAIVRAL